MKTIIEHKKDENKIMVNFYETNYNYYITLLNNHINNKPLKIFKKEYKKWKKEKEYLENNIITIEQKLFDLYKSTEDTI